MKKTIKTGSKKVELDFSKEAVCRANIVSEAIQGYNNHSIDDSILNNLEKLIVDVENICLHDELEILKAELDQK